MKKLIVLLVLIASTRTGLGQTVLARARVSNDVEGLTYVPSGPLKGSVVFVDGHTLRATTFLPAGPRSAVRDLLDLKTLPIVSKINGIAYVSIENDFVLWDFSLANTWFLLDQNAQPIGTRTITHLPGLGVSRTGEGMVYVPRSDRRFPDRILGVSYDAGFATHIEIFRRDGQAIGEIVPKGALDPSLEAISGIGYLSSGLLLIGTQDHFAWIMDMDGNVVLGPVDLSPASGIEGIVQVGDGTVVAAGYSDGRLLALDKRLRRIPSRDIDVHIGFGMAELIAVGWNPDTRSLLFVRETDSGAASEVDEMPLSLDSFDKVLDVTLGTNGVAYLGQEHRLAVPHPNHPRSVRLYKRDQLVSELVLEDPQPGAVALLTSIPTRSQFGFRLGPGGAPNTTVHFADPAGGVAGVVDLAALGIPYYSALAFFPSRPGDPNPDGNLAVTDPSNNRIVFLDLDATTILSTLDYRSPDTLDMVSIRLAYIDSGELAGSFVGMDGGNSEIVIFRP